jgi:hypothetical protein
MADTKWTIKGREFVNCNCSYGCPCQFNGLPTHGHCQAVGGFEIEQGHHGSTKLDGLKFVGIFRWPGAIHEGKGEAAVVIDERANEAQRAALLRILSGQDTEPGATVFNVFASTLEKVHEPIFAPIEFELDIAARRARVVVPGGDRGPRRADSQSSDWRAAPRAHRHGGQLRVHARRNRTRLDQDAAPNPNGACRLLRPIRRNSSLPERRRALSRHGRCGNRVRAAARPNDHRTALTASAAAGR